MHGNSGHCNTDPTYTQQSTAENPVAECVMYTYYTGITPGETIESALQCQPDTYRSGMVMSEANGDLPVLHNIDYRELPRDNREFYGAQFLVISPGNYADVYGNGGNTSTFEGCATMCKVYPGKQCNYFIWYGSSDPDVSSCDPGNTASNPNALCELWSGDQQPQGNQVPCTEGSFRHALMNTWQYQTWPVDPNGIPYTAIGGCGFGARC